MRVQAVQIEHFRSIASCAIFSCDNFNVLIGKNNSGKSNILYSINAFFTALSHGGVVDLDPIINRSVDLHNSDFTKPVEITLTFRMDDDDFNALITELRADAPQMTNAINALDRDSSLVVTICFIIEHEVYSFVKRVALAPPNLDPIRQNSSNTLLEVDPAAATVLCNNYKELRSMDDRVKAFNNARSQVDADDWMRFRRDIPERPRHYRYPHSFFHGLRAEPETIDRLNSMINNSATYDEFRTTLDREIDVLTTFADQFERDGLDEHFVGTFSGNASSVPKHVLTMLDNLSRVRVLNITDDRRPIGREEAQKLLDLKVQRGGQNDLQRIQNTVSSLLDVNIDAFSGGSTNTSGVGAAELDVDDFIVEVNGSGIKEALRLLLDIEFQAPDLLLVEEPEIHLHPALETTMMRYLSDISLERQVFITTHSTNFLDTAARSNIYLVSKDESSFAQKLEPMEIEERIPSELGIRLSSLFIYDRLVFVESKTDEDIIREWASTLKFNLDQSNVGFIHMGGARNLSYFAAEQTLAFLQRRQVQLFFMIDRDEKSEHDINRIKDSLGDNVMMHVLAKREIENYLIIPEVLMDWLSSRLDNREGRIEMQLDLGNLTTEIDDCAENLKDETIFKRVAQTSLAPLYPDRSASPSDIAGKTPKDRVAEQVEVWEERLTRLRRSIDDEIVAKSRDVDQQWATHKLDMVPGDVLIDMVASRYGLRFDKSRGDGVKLAKLMSSNKIDPEIAELIRTFVD